MGNWFEKQWNKVESGVKNTWDKIDDGWENFKENTGIKPEKNPYNTSAERQKMYDALDSIPTIRANEDYLTSVIPDELNDVAEAGYGQDWINSMFELKMDDSARQLAGAEQRLLSAATQSGLTENNMLKRNRDNVRFGYGKQAGVTLGGIMNENEEAKSQAKRVLAQQLSEETNYKDYVDSLNEQMAWEAEKLYDRDRLEQDFASTIERKQNRDARNQIGTGLLRFGASGFGG